MKKRKIKIQKLWNMNPKTRITDSDKKYSRKKKRKELKDLLKEVL